ncbi:MAG: muramidase, partial [Lamprobacter sp.]|nr:muramidase [Lamprobacter sp.]
MAGMLATGASLAGEGHSRKAISAELQGRLQSQYRVGDSLSGEIADTIAARVSSETSFQTNLAESVRQDAQQGNRSVFTEGLSRQDSAQLQESASDLVQDSRAHQRAERLSQSAAASGSYRAAEVGQRLASQPALAQQAYGAIDRLGLTGDHERVASWYNAMGVFANPEQARAAAAMHLLAGFAQPERALSDGERLQARETAFGLLGEAFHGPGGTGADPEPVGGVGGFGAGGTFGSTRDQVMGAGLFDPRAAAAGLGNGAGAISTGAAGVDAFHAGAQSRFAGVEQGQTQRVAAARAAHWERQIITEANSYRSPAEASTDALAGGIENLLRRGMIKGDRAIEAFNGLLSGLQSGEGWQGAVAVAQARERYGDAISTLADYQLQTLPPQALTESQEAFYRGRVDWAWMGHTALSGVEITLPSHQAQLDRLIDEHGPELGQAIAGQLTDAAHSLDNSKLTGIIAYNRAQSVVDESEKKTLESGSTSQGLIHFAVTGGVTGQVLDLVAGPESLGNYNALYRDANQSALNLSDLTLHEIQALQQRLVAERGGSPVGRYQIIDDTLDDLMNRLGLNGQERFTPELQDRMAMTLARDAGLEAWQAGRLPDDAFAHNLSRIWAGLPADASNQSYYEGVAGNRATVAWSSVMDGLERVR